MTRGRNMVLNGYLRANRRMRVVGGKTQIFEAIVEKRVRAPFENQRRQRPRVARQLQFRLLQMVVIQMAVTARPDKIARIQVALMRDHVRKQRVRCDVERNAQECVGASLVELARKPAVRNVKLKQHMARRQRHFRQIDDIPRAYDEPARIGIPFDFLENLRELIDNGAVGRRPRPPLLTVDRPEFALLVRPFVPNRYAVIVQILDVRVAAQKPQELVHDRTRVKLFGRYQRKPIMQIEAHLVAENTSGSGSRPIAFFDAGIDDMTKKIEILLHVTALRRALF